MRMRRSPVWEDPAPGRSDTGRNPGRVPAETEHLVRLRAGGRCEACRTELTEADPCSWVYVALGWTDEAVYSGPANAVLLCPACWRLADALDTRMEARGFCVWSGPDPRLMPMIVPGDDGSWAPVWRSQDGRYLLEPPELPSA